MNQIANAGSGSTITPEPPIFDMGLQLAVFLASLVSMPLEFAWRRHFGSRYFGPVVLLFSPGIVVLWSLVATAAGAATSIVSRNNARGPIIGMGIFYLVFIALYWFRVVQIIRTGIKYRDVDSRHDGDSYLLHFLPRGSDWVMQRFIYEPGITIVVAAVLAVSGVLHAGAASFLILASIAMVMKASFLWYMTWSQIRDLLDMRYYAIRMREAIPTVTEKKNVASKMFSLATLPVPDDLRRKVYDHAQHVMPEQYKRIISIPESATMRIPDGANTGMEAFAGMISAPDSAFAPPRITYGEQEQ